ncbi:MAG: DNA starvation/stationary phase protection protein [Acidimicrobiales bacterium]
MIPGSRALAVWLPSEPGTDPLEHRMTFGLGAETEDPDHPETQHRKRTTTMSTESNLHRTVPGLDSKDASKIVEVAQTRLVSLLDLQLTLKHIHWNLVGPDFLSVHEMLDTQVAQVREATDELAERMRTMGGVPAGTPGAIVEHRTWDDYAIGRGLVTQHLRELDSVYTGIIIDHRKAIEASAADPVTEDLFIKQTAMLEMAQWFVRSFIESTSAQDLSDEDLRRLVEHKTGMDLDEVGRNIDEMNRVGANISGEGAI